MKKIEELKDPRSCFNRAGEHERMFVLLERDIAAPAVIRFWVGKRVALGKNKLEDPQIQEALDCAALMELKQRNG